MQTLHIYLTGAVLFIGSGPIKGFATTLLIGIITLYLLLFFIARIFIDWSLKKK
jgi:SecD/SecF fusion protein